LVPIQTHEALGAPTKQWQRRKFNITVMIHLQTEGFEGNQRDSPEGSVSGNKGIPAISRKRFPGWSRASCFLDASRSLSVKG
jgi:hypothetical protein